MLREENSEFFTLKISINITNIKYQNKKSTQWLLKPKKIISLLDGTTCMICSCAENQQKKDSAKAFGVMDCVVSCKTSDRWALMGVKAIPWLESDIYLETC